MAQIFAYIKHMCLASHARLICSIFISATLALPGCSGVLETYPSSIRSIADKAELSISPGDSRNEVRSILGEPLILVDSPGLEVYRLDGRDTDLHLMGPIPLLAPIPGDDVTLIAMVLYDKHESVRKVAMDV